MPTFIPTQILETKPWQSAHGPLYGIKMSGTLDGEYEPMASINVKDPSRTPQLNVPIDVTYERTQYGVNLKKSPPPPPGQQAPIPYQQGGPVPISLPPAPPQPQRASYDRSDERAFIIRQNALTNAVAYCTAKAGLMTKEKGEKYLEGKKVIEVAHYFAKFSLGEVPFPYKDGSEVFTERNTEEEPPPDDITPEEIEELMNGV